MFAGYDKYNKENKHNRSKKGGVYMKYLGRLTVMAAAAWMMTGCVQQTKQAEYLGVDAAKAIALAAADITESDAVFTTAELEEKNGLSYYEIDFTVGGQEYDYDIDAISGKIIENQTKAVDDTAANEATTANTTNAASDGQVTLEEAKEIALNHAGLSADGVTFIKGKLERDDGREKYDIEFYTSDFKEYDYEIDPQTGEILSYDYDAEDYAPQKSSTGNSSAITEAKAKEIRRIAEGLIALAVKEKDNYETVTVQAKVARKDKDGKRVKEDGKVVFDTVEKTIKKDNASRLHARRQMLKVLYAVTEIPADAAGRKAATKKVDLVDKLFTEIAPKYADRNGGYTRIVKIGQRKGDAAMEVLIELI